VASEHTSHAHISGTYELAVTRAVAGLVAPGAVCYDLGASIGYLSLLMAKKARRVYAFEPAPHAAAELQKHAAANGFAHITVVPHPVSESRRLVTFALTDNAYGSSISADPKWPKLQLTTVTLDDFARDHAPPDFVKLDVEGEEGRVLEGARAILRDRPPVICCELHSVEAARHVCAILSAHDYRLTDLAGRPFVVPSHIVTGHEVHLVAQPA
jgi:FkbM family methyltransferase